MPPSKFGTELRDRLRAIKHRPRRWLFVPYDQLSDRIGPLRREDPASIGIVMLENPWKASRRPYHRQKLALVLANMRHFALEQAARGVTVRYEVCHGPYRNGLEALCRELGPLEVMEPAEWELRKDLRPLVQEGLVRVLPHEGWLTSPEDFRRSQGGKKVWRMDAFYRAVRKAKGVLVEDGKPAGGKWSFDPENRKAWPGDPPAPSPPHFKVDPVKSEVVRLVETHFSHHPGDLDLDHLPATLEDAELLWKWAKEECLPWFGPFEDAMSIRSGTLFHTRVSALLNLCRLLPSRLIEDILRLPIPLPSQEGFVRQILGWREFMRHVHAETEGFRSLGNMRVREEPGAGGYQGWSGQPWRINGGGDNPDGGAVPSFLGASGDVLPAFWGRESGLFCLDRVVDQVWREGYSHHITRLMVLSNLGTLLEIAPRDLADWFWVAYIDAFDWVVEPNVLGMGSYALGDLFTTKPYVSGAAYIDRMSDFCGNCRFDPKQNCPFTSLYWAFLARHAEALKRNPRMSLPLRSLERRPAQKRLEDARVFERVRGLLVEGAVLDPKVTGIP